MSQSDAVKVLDLIRALPATDPYQHLRDPLLRMYALTDYARFEDISSLPLSGDMLPSALMSKMLALLLLIIRPVSSYMEPSSIVSHRMSGPT